MLFRTLWKYRFVIAIAECPTPVNILAIVLGVIGGIILIGLLLLLIWKLLVTIHDRREYARFEKERENARWDMVIFALFFIMYYCCYVLYSFIHMQNLYSTPQETCSEALSIEPPRYRSD